jgi:predicted nuclease of predicted toxin-antitoxin system
VKLLLDENFPLPLYHELQAAEYDVDHLIVLGQRGLPDAVIRQRLASEEIVFLTQDTEFEDLTADYRAIVIIPHVRQNLPIQQHVDIWLRPSRIF